MFWIYVFIAIGIVSACIEQYQELKRRDEIVKKLRK